MSGKLLLLEKSSKFFDSLSLKIIALIAMILDHIGAVLFPNIYFFRFIGRMAFPIYAFLLVQGYIHTKGTPKFKKYLERLVLFGCISEIIFDLTFFNKLFYLGYQNIYFTLSLGLISLYYYDKIEAKGKDGFYVILFAATLSFLLKFDYGMLGIIFISLMYLIEKIDIPKAKLKTFLTFMTLILFSVIEICINSLTLSFPLFFDLFLTLNWIFLGIPISGIFISNYNGKQGYKNRFLQLFFYWAYPIHLLIIFIIKILTNYPIMIK